jgi:predicted XRE-type DNA-binding protein
MGDIDSRASCWVAAMSENTEAFEFGSGNIFADLGLPDAENHFLKAKIVAELYRLSNAQKLTQAKAGERITDV